MKIRINGRQITAIPGASLLEHIRDLGLDAGSLSKRPLAARIAGEVFNLNYVPLRPEDIHGDEIAVRKAMVASAGNIELLYYSDPAGRDVYDRTVHFVLFLAIHRLWPKARAKMNCTVGRGLYIEVRGAENFSVEALKNEFSCLVSKNIPLLRRRVPVQTAVEHFSQSGQLDKARLLQCTEGSYVDEYYYEDYSNFHYGELAPSSGFLQVWDIIDADGGIMFLFPDYSNPDLVADYEEMPNFLSVSTEGERWCELMECETVADLNELVRNNKIRELIRVNEALHESRFAQVADMVCRRNARAVMLAGPSSSGKTTSANRLATQLRVHGKKPILMSLDDYYIDRDKIFPGPDGKLDLEHINTIDTELFRYQMQALFRGEMIELPSFNFKTGKREWRGHSLRLEENAVIIVEGLHALNPALLPGGVNPDIVFKLYVSPLLPLNLDDHNRIPTSLLRLLRRTVRDYETRGSSVQRTMSMWDSVRRGEKIWIFPYQENADVIFNSSTLYELAVLKKHIYPLLLAVDKQDECFDDVQNLVNLLSYVQEADVDDEIPPTSLVREFIGGNSFYK